MSGNVLYFILAVNRQQPDFILLFLEVIDHPHATTFSFTCNCPADLSDATKTTNDFACFRILKQKTLQTQILIVGEVIIHILCKDSGFNKFHKLIIRLCRRLCKSLFSSFEMNRLTAGVMPLRGTGGRDGTTLLCRNQLLAKKPA
jgi:hypothetical protein